MKLLRKSLAGLTAATLALSLAACGESEASDANTVEFWYYQPTTEQAAKIQKLADEFESEHPDVKIDLVQVPKDDYNTKLASALANQNGPDAGYLDQPQMARYAESGQLAEVLGSPATVVPALAFIAAWQSGTCMLIFLAGLKGIPRAYYEASEVDGANARQRLWRITLPMLRPTTFFLSVTGMISALQVFGIVYVLFSGNTGPEASGLTYVLHLYLAGFRNGAMGAASAMSFLLFVAILLITAAQFRLMPRDYEE
jgi:ABC-type sugar transport system permease subunit